MVASRRPTGGERRQDVRHLPDHRGCLSPSGLRRRADSGGEVRRPAGSPRCAARWRLDFARMRAVVVEGLMRAGGVVIREVPAQQTAEVPFVDHDDVVEAFPTNRADDALGEGILPGHPRRDKHLAYTQAFPPPYEHIPVDGIPITWARSLP